MKVDFIKQESTLEAKLTFRQMGILQEALQVQYQSLITETGTNTADAAEELEGLSFALGIDIDNSCESLEDNAV